ncbi:TPA: hypothetical protein KOY69_002001 [Clostridioides difficile]|nr:hypothetical protein [Clostridioides difficile]HBF8167720.1 hypothetical protein [Clostridioides difficile]
MKISELINELNKMKDIFGDLKISIDNDEWKEEIEVTCMGYNGEDYFIMECTD